MTDQDTAGTIDKPGRGRPRAFCRETALRKAMETFWALGYEGASMAELTRAMGVGSPSLYAAFGSKDALFREACRLYERESSGAMIAAIEDPATAREGIEGYLMTTADGLSAPGHPPGCMIVLAAVSAHGACEAAREELKGRRTAVVAMLERRLARGVASGELPKGLDIAAIAAFYVTVQQGMSIQAVDGASTETLRGVARGAMAAWDGLVGAGAAPD
ncbi:TetR/AcrR family transcriptional regulator [Chenggangzhangella methanolivorans]|nr:TetR/AcrR family transcriptional regulator [Chenggangzhangella methanolivorans]